ncbi:PseG/SpsG family protein [Ruminiclostridium sufflavum]|nr:glycosyltransferase [Ruminiclostridium sufflavum]
MYNIAIRADGGSAVGIGHIMRCLVIAEQLKNLGCRVYFLGRYRQGSDKAKEMGFESFEIAISSSEAKSENSCAHKDCAEGFNYGRIEELEEELLATGTIIKQQGCDLLIVDKYNLSSEYFNRLREFNKRVAFIDDLNLFSCAADIIINGNINAELLEYKKCFAAQKLLLGTNYTLLRREFRDIPQREIRSLSGWRNTLKKSSGNEILEQNRHCLVTDSLVNTLKRDENDTWIPEVMITTGGADPYNFTGKLLKILLGDNKTEDIRYNVIVSSGFIYKDEIKEIAKSNSKVVLYIDYKYLSDVMQRSDLAISSGGSTLYELCCCGTPAIAFVLADNQKGIVDMLSREGYIQAIGWYAEIEKNNLVQMVYDLLRDFKLRKGYSKKMQGLIDGKGALRIAESLIDLLKT